MRIALFGGVYNNHIGLEAACEDAVRRGCKSIYCLGDLGAFGPSPDKVFPILKKFKVQVVKGNYDDSVARGLEDCQCGYTDPRDNYFAHLSYKYTLSNTNSDNREFLASLPSHMTINDNSRGIYLCHGSPRRINEFLWESTSPTHLLEKFSDDYKAEIICVTHTGIHWKRALSNNRWFVNVGVIGRPPNDGSTDIYYTILDTSLDDPVEFVAVRYDHQRLAGEMEQENLPGEFIETVLTGYWTTCLEILPAKERKRGKF